MRRPIVLSRAGGLRPPVRILPLGERADLPQVKNALRTPALHALGDRGPELLVESEGLGRHNGPAARRSDAVRRVLCWSGDLVDELPAGVLHHPLEVFTELAKLEFAATPHARVRPRRVHAGAELRRGLDGERGRRQSP